MNTGTNPATLCTSIVEVPSGAHAVVREIQGRDSAMLRLMAMGLCVGREIAVLRQGNPLIIQLLGARVGLSAQVALRIIVERRPS